MLVFKIFVSVVFFIVALIGVFTAPFYFWGDRKVAQIEAEAPTFLQTHGFAVIGREGFTTGLFLQPGGCVWYTMKRTEEPQTLYHACVAKYWDNKLELWNLRAINAIRPEP